MASKIIYTTDTGARVGWVVCDDRNVAERVAQSVIGADTVHGFIVAVDIEEE
jgi:hypothetical protein